MLEKLMMTVFFVICLFVAPNLSYAESVYKNRPFEFGFGIGSKYCSLENGFIPDSVKKEAENPTIISPYSGRLYDKQKIGTFNPNPNNNLDFTEGGMYLKCTPYQDSFFSPYFKLGLVARSEIDSTINGSYGRGYTYATLLGTSGVDYIRYVYGVEYQHGSVFIPEIGIRIMKKDFFSVLAGISYQELIVNYFKGIESWGKPGYLQKIGSSKHQFLNYKLSFKLTDKDFSFVIEPSLIEGDGIKGYGVAIFAFMKL